MLYICLCETKSSPRSGEDTANAWSFASCGGGVLRSVSFSVLRRFPAGACGEGVAARRVVGVRSVLVCVWDLLDGTLCSICNMTEEWNDVFENQTELGNLPFAADNVGSQFEKEGVGCSSEGLCCTLLQDLRGLERQRSQAELTAGS